MSSEQSIASARASVMIYDDVNKKWIPSGSSSGLSKVHVFQHQVNNTFRVVGRKLQNQEVVINCVILKSLKYNQATSTFHQWRDNKQVYGLNFSSKEDADSFARAMLYAVEVLASAPRPAVQQFPSPPVYPQTNGQYEEDMGYRTMTREDVAVLQERRMSQHPSAVSPPGPQQPPTLPGHHRTSSAPPAPQPPPLSVATPPAPPPAPAMPPLCPPPPPLPNSGANTLPRSSSSDLNNQHHHQMQQHSPSPSPQDMGSLAAQLQSARLKRANKQSAENSGSSTTSSSSGGGGGGGYSTLGRGNTGMASMMDEMAKTLARRRAAVEKKDPEPNSAQDSEGGSGSIERRGGSVGSVTWNNNSKAGSNTSVATNGWESPKTSRKNLAASSEDVASKVNGEMNGGGGGYITPADLDNVKQEILREMRRELGKLKTEIVDAIKLELSKR
ncbi:hypothetical protein M8J75_010662 [Diaphorina citri]|nr:hypothetical protein M8J75_010662 [Diaphorina citri]